jgi:uncharacterized membrane protein
VQFFVKFLNYSSEIRIVVEYLVILVLPTFHLLSTVSCNTQAKCSLNLPMFSIIFARVLSRLLTLLIWFHDRFSIYSTIGVATIRLMNALVLVRCWPTILIPGNCSLCCHLVGALFLKYLVIAGVRNQCIILQCGITIFYVRRAYNTADIR